LLPHRDGIDHVIRDAQRADDLLVEHAHAAGRHGAHRELLVAGDAQLAHEEYVERRTERTGDFIRDGHAAAREGEHQDLRTMGVGFDLLGEEPARFVAIAKTSEHEIPPWTLCSRRALVRLGPESSDVDASTVPSTMKL